jgi:hypothetical protein
MALPYQACLMRCLRFALVFVAACSGKPITDTCASVSSTGTAPHCILSAECVGAHTGVQLDCSGAGGQCVCSENGVVGATVTYQDSFCSGGNPNDVTSYESSLEAANGACGWKL